LTNGGESLRHIVSARSAIFASDDKVISVSLLTDPVGLCAELREDMPVY